MIEKWSRLPPLTMRIWCVPSATELENSPKLPPRIDRDVYLRSPPPPPRLSKEQKLARGVIVVKPNKKARKSRKSSSTCSSKSTLGSNSSPPTSIPTDTRISPSSSSNNGSTLGTSKSQPKKYYRNTFKAHINNGGSVTSSSSLILHPGTSRTRQKKIKKRKKGKHNWEYWTTLMKCTFGSLGYNSSLKANVDHLWNCVTGKNCVLGSPPPSYKIPVKPGR